MSLTYLQKILQAISDICTDVAAEIGVIQKVFRKLGMKGTCWAVCVDSVLLLCQ